MSRHRTRLAVVACAVLVATSAGCAGIVDEAAHDRLMDALGDTTVTVYPTVIRTRTIEYDEASATELADYLREQELTATAEVSDEHVAIPGPWHRNQARMLRESAESFAAHLSSNPVETDYALLAEYLIGSRAVGGIHCYVLEPDGTVAFVVLLNSHHAPFSRVDPKTREDCTRVLLEVLDDELGDRSKPARVP
ncbi:MAG: hypothetical protein ACYTG1_02815 [Planctomycetota bacterium]|jgi:hypothetical protein